MTPQASSQPGCLRRSWPASAPLPCGLAMATECCVCLHSSVRMTRAAGLQPKCLRKSRVSPPQYDHPRTGRDCSITGVTGAVGRPETAGRMMSHDVALAQTDAGRSASHEAQTSVGVSRITTFSPTPKRPQLVAPGVCVRLATGGCPPVAVPTLATSCTLPLRGAACPRSGGPGSHPRRRPA